MILPNISVFCHTFGGQVLAFMYGLQRKASEDGGDGLINGQTLRSLPNMILQMPDGEKFTTSGMFCVKNGWNWCHLNTPITPQALKEGATVNIHGVVPFDFKGKEGSDPRVDAMRDFMRDVCIRMDHELAKHWQDKPQARPAKVSRAPSESAMNALGI